MHEIACSLQNFALRKRNRRRFGWVPGKNADTAIDCLPPHRTGVLAVDAASTFIEHATRHRNVCPATFCTSTFCPSLNSGMTIISRCPDQIGPGHPILDPAIRFGSRSFSSSKRVIVDSMRAIALSSRPTRLSPTTTDFALHIPCRRHASILVPPRSKPIQISFKTTLTCLVFSRKVSDVVQDFHMSEVLFLLSRRRNAERTTPVKFTPIFCAQTRWRWAFSPRFRCFNLEDASRRLGRGGCVFIQ